MENSNLLNYEQIYEEYNQICSDYNDDIITSNQYDNKMDILNQKLIDFLSYKYPELMYNIDNYKYPDLLDYVIESLNEEDFIYIVTTQEVDNLIEMFDIDVSDYIDKYYESKQK